jgi:hypothetical protein
MYGNRGLLAPALEVLEDALHLLQVGLDLGVGGRARRDRRLVLLLHGRGLDGGRQRRLAAAARARRKRVALGLLGVSHERGDAGPARGGDGELRPRRAGAVLLRRAASGQRERRHRGGEQQGEG